jgi:hypothetical protein
MPTPTPEEIQKAGRQLQRGGPLGRGSAKLANKLVDEAGNGGREVAGQILSAAADYEPHWWAR